MRVNVGAAGSCGVKSPSNQAFHRLDAVGHSLRDGGESSLPDHRGPWLGDGNYADQFAIHGASSRQNTRRQASSRHNRKVGISVRGDMLALK
jgi:hypothetical protein